jgi:hypothetical protein
VDLLGLMRLWDYDRQPNVTDSTPSADFSAVRPWALLAHLLSLPVAFVFIVATVGRSWFGGDEWDFFVNYDLVHRPFDLFLPHNEHLSVLPLLVFKALFLTVGLSSYVPYAAVLALTHVGTAHLLWRLANRAGSDPWLSTILAAIFLFNGGGFFNIVIAFQMSFIGSTGFGLAAILVLDTPRPVSRNRLLAVWTLCLASIFCSGLGTAFTLIAVLFAALRHGWRSGILVATVPLLFYACWFAIVGRHHVTALGMVGKSAFLQIPDFLWVGLTTALEKVTGLSGAGAPLVLGLGAYLVMRRVWRDRRADLVTALALGAVVFLAVVAPGRLLFGPQYAGQSRYVYELWALLLVPAAVILTRVFRRDRVSGLLILSVLVLILARDAYDLKGAAADRVSAAATDKARILAAARLISRGEPVVGSGIGGDDVTTLETLLRLGALPLSEAPPEDSSSALDARLELEVKMKNDAVTAPTGTVAFQRGVGVNVGASAAPCSTFDAVDGSLLWLASSGRSSIALTSLQGGRMHVSLQSAFDPSSTARAVDFQLPRGERELLSFDIPRTLLVLSLPAGSGEICGVQVSPR